MSLASHIDVLKHEHESQVELCSFDDKTLCFDCGQFGQRDSAMIVWQGGDGQRIYLHPGCAVLIILALAEDVQRFKKEVRDLVVSEQKYDRSRV